MHGQGVFRGFNLRLAPLPTWRTYLLALVGGTIAITLAVTAAGLFLVLLPVVLVAGVVDRMLLGWQQKPGQPICRGAVFEGRYEVVEVKRPDEGGWGR